MMQETRVRSVGQEDPLQKGMAIHSSILAWRIPWTEKPDRLYRSWVCKELDTTERLTQLIQYLPNTVFAKNLKAEFLFSLSLSLSFFFFFLVEWLMRS